MAPLQLLRARLPANKILFAVQFSELVVKLVFFLPSKEKEHLVFRVQPQNAGGGQRVCACVHVCTYDDYWV